MTVLDMNVDWVVPMEVNVGGRFIAASHSDGTGTRIWDLRTGQQPHPLYTIPCEGKGMFYHSYFFIVIFISPIY